MVAEILEKILTIKLSPLDFSLGYWGLLFRDRGVSRLKAVLYLCIVVMID